MSLLKCLSQLQKCQICATDSKVLIAEPIVLKFFQDKLDFKKLKDICWKPVINPAIAGIEFLDPFHTYNLPKKECGGFAWFFKIKAFKNRLTNFYVNLVVENVNDLAVECTLLIDFSIKSLAGLKTFGDYKDICEKLCFRKHDRRESRVLCKISVFSSNPEEFEELFINARIQFLGCCNDVINEGKYTKIYTCLFMDDETVKPTCSKNTIFKTLDWIALGCDKLNAFSDDKLELILNGLKFYQQHRLLPDLVPLAYEYFVFGEYYGIAELKLVIELELCKRLCWKKRDVIKAAMIIAKYSVTKYLKEEIIIFLDRHSELVLRSQFSRLDPCMFYIEEVPYHEHGLPEYSSEGNSRCPDDFWIETVDGKSIGFNKNILREKGGVFFNTILNAGMKESETSIMIVPDFDISTLKGIKLYLYNGVLNCGDKNMFLYYEFAHMYLVESLEEEALHCIFHLLEEDKEILKAAYDKSILYSCKPLRDRIIEVLEKYSKSIITQHFNMFEWY